MGRQAKFTKQELIAALRQESGDLTRTAVALEVSPSTVYRAMVRHGVTVKETRQIVAA